MNGDNKAESRKKGIALTAILALAALKPTNYIELGVAGGIVLIALYAIRRQANIDLNKEKNNVKEDVNKSVSG